MIRMEELASKTRELKQKITLGLDRIVIEKAKAEGINISAITEELLKAITYEPIGNTKEDVIKAYEALFETAKPILEKYRATVDVGIEQAYPIVLDYKDGLYQWDGVDPDTWSPISVSKSLRFLYPPQRLVREIISALIRAAENNRDEIRELKFALRIINGLHEEKNDNG
jgi:hypothetical protein